MRLILEPELDFSDVLIEPQRSTLTSRKDVILDREFTFKHTNKRWTGFPIISANMSTGTFKMASVLSTYKMLTSLHKHYSLSELVTFFKNNEEITDKYVFYTLGINDKDLDKYNNFKKQYKAPELVTLDAANGYTQAFVNFVKRFRDDNPNAIIMAGNVVTGNVAEELLLSGADIIKTGIGSGAQCLTRRTTSVGRAQLSAVLDVANASHGLGGLCCSDGGIVEIGDICVALAAGSDFIMMGSMFSGYEETDGETIEQDGKKFKKFFGMSSNTAMNLYNGGKASYKASEGRTTLVPYRGDVEEIILEIRGGISSMMTYIGAHKLKEISKRATLRRVNNKLNKSYEKYTIGN